jgi:hypothetical protein
VSPPRPLPVGLVLAVCALTTLAPASAAADPAVTLDRSCYSPGQTITRTGTGFAPGSQVSEAVAFQTDTMPVISLGSVAWPTIVADPQGAFKDTVRAPNLRRPTRDFTETAIDTFTDPANPAKPATVKWTLSDW